MARTTRDFSARPAEEWEWMLRQTWCGACREADLGMHSAQEYEENGRVYLEGRCLRCGHPVRTEIIDEIAG